MRSEIIIAKKEKSIRSCKRVIKNVKSKKHK